LELFDRDVRSIIASGKEVIVKEKVTDITTGEIRFYRSLKKPISLPVNSEPALLIIAHDVTDLNKRLLDMEERERRYDYAMNAAGEGIWDWDIVKGLVTHNQTWCDILGYNDALVHPLEFFADLIHPDDEFGMQERINKALSGEADYESEHRIRRINGSYIWVLDRGRVVEFDENHVPLRMVGSFSDATIRREAEEKLQIARDNLEKTNALLEDLVDERTSELVTLNLELEQMLRKDPLTGLANRLAADDFLYKKFEQLQQGGVSFALMLIDVDHFKQVNDTYGHPVGDHALRHLAKEMNDTLDEHDFLARFGGEEFLMVHTTDNQDVAMAWAERLCQRIAASVIPHHESIKLTISIGLLFIDDKDLPINEAFRIADVCLYQAKHDGRNCVRTCIRTTPPNI
ncbi:MAG: diguanylate cyclase, partial [Oleibacter sp.]|nr:diguanylate cyclase [Thalassolituus sp.]